MTSDPRTFFKLLRYSIGASDEVLPDMSEQEWLDIYETAKQQSLLGVIFYGIKKNPESKLPRNLLLKWYGASEQIRRMNIRSNRMAVAVSKFFQNNYPTLLPLNKHRTTRAVACLTKCPCRETWVSQL